MSEDEQTEEELLAEMGYDRYDRADAPGDHVNALVAEVLRLRKLNTQLQHDLDSYRSMLSSFRSAV